MLVSAGTSTGMPSNRGQPIRFGDATNALIDASSPSGARGTFTVTPPGGAEQVTFTARRATANLATHVPFEVVDGCGAWETFVGGGPRAF